MAAKTIARMKKTCLLAIAYCVSFFLLPISFLLWILNFRFLNVNHFYSIGHLAAEPDCYIKESILENKTKRKVIIVAPTRHTFFSYPKLLCCNEPLLDLWKQYFYVIKSPYLALLCKILRLFKFLDETTRHYVQNYFEDFKIYKINYYWKGPPSVSLPQSIQEKGKEALRFLGVPEGAPFVVFANRDSAYRKCEKHFTCRNNDVNDYHLALKELVHEGYYCIRLGHHQSQPLNWDLLKGYEKYIIDYTRSTLSSGCLDLFFAAQAKMFLSGPSGLNMLAALFQVPLVLVGQVSLSNFPLRHCDLSLPKIYLDSVSGQEIPFKTILESKMGFCILDDEYQKQGISLRKNSPEEILMAVREELLYLREGTIIKTTLQCRFESLIPESNYASPMASRVSEFFLAKYEFLL